MIGMIIAGFILALKLKSGLAVAVLAAAKFFFIWSIIATGLKVLLVGGMFGLTALLVGLGVGFKVNTLAGILSFLGINGLSLLGTIRMAIIGSVGIVGGWALMHSVTILPTGYVIWDKTTLIVALIFLVVNLIIHRRLPLKITRSVHKQKSQEED